MTMIRLAALIALTACVLALPKALAELTSALSRGVVEQMDAGMTLAGTAGPARALGCTQPSSGTDRMRARLQGVTLCD